MQCDCINRAASVRFYVRFVWKSMPVSPNTRAILQNCWVANICLFGMLQSLALLSANASAFARWKVEMWQTIFQKSWKWQKIFQNCKKILPKVQKWQKIFQKSWNMEREKLPQNWNIANPFRLGFSFSGCLDDPVLTHCEGDTGAKRNKTVLSCKNGKLGNVGQV